MTEREEEMSTAACDTSVVTRHEHLDMRVSLLKAIMTGTGAWSHEARAVLARAQAFGVVLDEERLIYSDVRDLQTLYYRLGQRRGEWSRPATSQDGHDILP